jgi:ATP-dependent helicase/nuclease subunit B
MNHATLHIGLHRLLQRPAEGSHEVNVVRGGPMQLLAWVETQLGVNGPDIPWTDRVVAYHLALRRAGGASYEASFQADAWATASYLLKRRDELLLSGWQRQAVGDPMVDELARVDDASIPPGIPDRVALVLDRLDHGLRLPDHQAHLDEPIEDWPPLWQDLLKRLHVTTAPPPPPAGQGALQIIQENLLYGQATEARIDDSIVALRTASRHTAVQFTARWLRKHHATIYCADPVVATMLDAALHADGQPAMGAMRESRGQPAQQILPLTMGLLWQPVNPYVLLDFLLLPIGPVRSFGRKLARALERQPGYQSDAWNKAVKEVLADDEDGRKAEKIQKWLDHERIDFGGPVPTELVQQRCGLVAQWTSGRAQWEMEQDEPDGELASALSIAASQASALGSIAGQLGATITEAQLGRLLDEVRSEGSADAPFQAEAGGSRIVTSLADVPDTDQLVWLGTQSQDAPRSAWTPRQASLLHDVGIDVRHRHTLRTAEERGLARAKRLLVVDIAAIEGRRHPIWLRMHGDLNIGGKLGGDLPLLEALIAQGKAPVPTRLVEAAATPTKRIRWEAGAAIPVPGHTSATAIEDQLTCPLKWTLRHALMIRPSSTASIPEDVRLKGNFAHELMKVVFTPGAPPGPLHAEQRMGEAFDELLPKNAATLAIPRKLAERSRLRRQLCNAARHFAQVLQEGGYEVVGLEVDTTGDLDGVPVKGSIDCVLRDGTGEVIVDFKFGGATKYQAKLAEGRALQLAAYAQDRDAPVHACAYFVLANNRILTPSAGAMRQATRVVEGPDVQSTWRRLRDALTSTTAWLQDGIVHARPVQGPAEWPPGSNVGLDMEKPESACAYCDYTTLCGREVLQ